MDKPECRIVTVKFGCDPEVFIKKTITTKKGNKVTRIVGSERLLPEEGIKIGAMWNDRGTLVRDGVQVELNPTSEPCRANHINNVKELFIVLRDEVNKKKDMKICFDQVVTITKKELMSLSPKSRQFGCMPSFNFYDTKELKAEIAVDPKKYMKRSGGGHLHLGEGYKGDRVGIALRNYDKIIPLLDLVVGNTCVIIDRNPLNAERRKVYGRAGEFRMPAYGVEYRTLSNFWLRDSQIFSLVTGLARTAVSILVNSTDKKDYYKEIMALVDIKEVQKAINENDLELAKKNWDKIKGWIATNVTQGSYGTTIKPDNLELIDYFFDKGLDYWFAKSDKKILDNWCTQPEGHVIGFEEFLIRIVKESKDKNKKIDWHKVYDKDYDEDNEDEDNYEEDEDYNEDEE
jgi:hypothetical protein